MNYQLVVRLEFEARDDAEAREKLDPSIAWRAGRILDVACNSALTLSVESEPTVTSKLQRVYDVPPRLLAKWPED